MDCGKLAAVARCVAFEDTASGLQLICRFFMKRKDLLGVTEVAVDWQEENSQFLHKMGGRDPQFFPQEACSKFGQVNCLRGNGESSTLGSERKAPENGTFLSIKGPNQCTPGAFGAACDPGAADGVACTGGAGTPDFTL